MTPDRGYQRTVRRLRVLCWIVSLALLVGCLAALDRFPVAAALLGLMSLGALRIADDCRAEIDSWFSVTLPDDYAGGDIRITITRRPR